MPINSKLRNKNNLFKFLYTPKILMFALLITAVAIYYALQSAQTSKNPQYEKIPFAPVVKVLRTNLSKDITLSAELVPYKKAILYAKVSGYLKTINVDIGDQVTTGEIIAQLEVPELRDELTSRKAKYDITKLEYNRLKKIPENHPGLIAQGDIDKAKAEYEIAQGNFEHAKTLIGFATITAPYDGIITKRYVDEGALIQLGTSSNTQAQPIVEIAESKKLRLVLSVPETIVTTIKVGDPAQVTIQSIGQQITGMIARMSNQVEFNTRTMQTEIDIDNSDLTMKAGMYASVKLLLDKKHNCLALPVQAVDLSAIPNVWVINTQNKIEQRPITINIKTPNLIGIESGLNEGDMVVFGNRDLLNVGMKVIPKIIPPESFKQITTKES